MVLTGGGRPRGGQGGRQGGGHGGGQRHCPAEEPKMAKATSRTALLSMVADRWQMKLMIPMIADGCFILKRRSSDRAKVTLSHLD